MTIENNNKISEPAKNSGANVGAAAPRLPANFELIRRLGSGGMADVYLARNRTLKRLVAIKVLRAELAADATSQSRFEREAQAAARLTHDSVTTVYSVGRTGAGRPYIEMQFVEGRNLADVLESRPEPFAVAEACSILRQVAAALAEAHARNIVHRDVKPANILLEDGTQRALLTDFGVAAILVSGSEAVTRLTRDDERLGDLRYMSPEQLRGETPTGQSDIYSLGIVGYEILTGKGPFDDPEIRSMAGAHLRQPPPRLESLYTGIPPLVARSLERCLSKRPEHRPRAQDLVADLNPERRSDDTPAYVTDGHPLSAFLAELKRRKVYRTAAAYAAFVFLVLQGADLLLPALPDGDRLYSYTVIACLSGFPVAVAISWIFDWRNGRLMRTGDDPASTENAKAGPQRILMLAGLGLCIAVAAGAAAWLL